MFGLTVHITLPRPDTRPGRVRCAGSESGLVFGEDGQVALDGLDRHSGQGSQQTDVAVIHLETGTVGMGLIALLGIPFLSCILCPRYDATRPGLPQNNPDNQPP